MSESTNHADKQLLTGNNEIQYSVNPEALLTNIRKTFDVSELHDLCFKLNIDYENLSGQNKRDKTRSLVETCSRQNRLLQLALFCQRERPDVAWIKTQEIPRNEPIDPPGISLTSEETTQRDSNLSDKKWLLGMASIFLLGAIGGLVLTALLVMPQLQIFTNRSLNRLLQPVLFYDFNEAALPREIQEADKTGTFVTGMKLTNRQELGDVLQVELNIPSVSISESLDNYSGGLCFPVDEFESIDAVSALIYAPEGAQGMIARMSVPFKEQSWTHSGQEQLQPGKWTPVFWGTGFAYYGDRWYEWLGEGADQVCIWITKPNGYIGPIYFDDIVVYQLKDEVTP